MTTGTRFIRLFNANNSQHNFLKYQRVCRR